MQRVYGVKVFPKRSYFGLIILTPFLELKQLLEIYCVHGKVN